MTSNKPIRKARWLALPIALLMALMLTLSTAFAGSLSVQDDANILSSSDRSALNDVVSRYGFDVKITSTNRSFNSRDEFANYIRSNSSGSRTLGIGIQPTRGWTYVEPGSSLGISNATASRIASAGDTSFASKNWRAGFESILSSAGSSTTVSRPGTSTSTSTGTSSSSGGFPFGLLVIGGIVLAIVVMVVLSRQRRSNQPQAYQQQTPIGSYDPGYGPGYVPGPNYGPGYGPNYGPNYGPGYNQGGSGIGSALGGAAIGGLAGYAIGSSMNQPHNGGYIDPNVGGGSTWDAGGGDVGGGSTWDAGGGDVGGGSSDWGGGGGDSGASGGFDFGGGGGDSGGSSDW